MFSIFQCKFWFQYFNYNFDFNSSIKILLLKKTPKDSFRLRILKTFKCSNVNLIKPQWSTAFQRNWQRNISKWHNKLPFWNKTLRLLIHSFVPTQLWNGKTGPVLCLYFVFLCIYFKFSSNINDYNWLSQHQVAALSVFFLLLLLLTPFPKSNIIICIL